MSLMSVLINFSSFSLSSLASPPCHSQSYIEESIQDRNRLDKEWEVRCKYYICCHIPIFGIG